MPGRLHAAPTSAVVRARRDRWAAALVLATVGACSSPSSEPVQVVEERPTAVRSVVVEPVAAMGHGRALAAHDDGEGSLVVVSTTGLQRVDAGVARTIVEFQAGGRPSGVAFGPDVVALAVPDLGLVRLHSSEDGDEIGSWPVPVGVDVRDLWFEAATGHLVVETSAGPAFLAPDGSVVLDTTASPMPLGRLAALPDGRIVGARPDANELVVIDGVDVARRPIAVGAGERVEDVRVSPDGERIGISVASSADAFEARHRVLLLDATLSPVGSVATGVRLDTPSWTLADGLLVGATESELIAWAEDGAEVGRAAIGAPVVSLHPVEGDVVVVGQDGGIVRWDGASPPATLTAGGVTTVFRVVDPAAQTITAVDLFGGIDVLDLGGEVLRSERALAVGELTSLAVSADGSTVAAGSTAGRAIVLDADLVPRNDLAAAPYGVRVDAVAFDPRDGDLVTGLAERVRSGAFDDSVTAWAADGTARFQMLGDIADVPGCAFFNARLRFDPSGTHLVAASHDFGVTVIEPETGEVLDELAGGATIVDLGFSSDGTRLVVVHDDGIVDVWDPASRTLLATYRPDRPAVGAIAVDPGGASMVVADLTGTLASIDVLTGETRLVFDGTVARSRALALSSDGMLLAAPTADGAIGFWSTATGAQIGTAIGHTGAVTALAFDPDARWLYSASDDGTVRSWSVVTRA